MKTTHCLVTGWMFVLVRVHQLGVHGETKAYKSCWFVPGATRALEIASLITFLGTFYASASLFSHLNDE